jgi:RNA polymerase sigma-70 factor, ECF subfamily
MAGSLPDDRSECTTSVSLLARVQARDTEAWARLVRLYGPVVYRWAREAGLQPADAADIAQDVFGSLMAHIRGFSHQQSSHTFRGWLWTITRNRVRDYYRAVRQPIRGTGGTNAHQRLEQIPDQPPQTDSGSGTRELSGVRRRLLELVREEFDPRTWTAFWRTAVEGDRPADVAADLGVSVWAIYKSRSRVLQRLRSELDGLLE